MFAVQRLQRHAEFARQSQYSALVLASVGGRRGADTDQRDFRVAQRFARIRGDRDPATGDDLVHQLDHPFLDDRRLATADQFEFGDVEVDADHLVAFARQAGERNCAYVAETEDTDVHEVAACEVDPMGNELTHRSMSPSNRCMVCGHA